MFACQLRVVVCAAAVLLVARSSQAASVYSQLVLSQTSPVVYWEQEETSGTTAGDLAPAGGSNTGTYVNATLGNAGPRPSDGFAGMNSGNLAPSVAQDGKTENTQLETVEGVPTNAYSAAVWFNSSVEFDTQVLHYFMERGINTASSGRRDGVGVGGTFSSTPTGRLFAVNDGTLATGTTLLTPDTWYQVVMVRDDSLSSEQLKIYLNGDPTPEITIDGAWGGGTGDVFRFGNRSDNNPSLGLTGRFDEAVIWDRALSPEEVENLFQFAFREFVPEPSSGSMFGLFALALAGRRSRKRRKSSRR